MIVNDYFPTRVLEHTVSSDIANSIEEYFTPYIPNVRAVGGIEDVYTDYYDKNKHSIPDTLKEIITDCLSFYFNDSDIQLTLKETWLQDYKDSSYHGMHNHPRSLISGVYYIRCDDNSNPLVFVNPDQVHNYLHDSGCEIVNVTRGKLILFPSHIYHYVPPSKDTTNRTVLAFNFAK